MSTRNLVLGWVIAAPCIGASAFGCGGSPALFGAEADIRLPAGGSGGMSAVGVTGRGGDDNGGSATEARGGSNGGEVRERNGWNANLSDG